MAYLRHCSICGAPMSCTDVHRHLDGPFKISGCHCDGRRPRRLEFGWPNPRGDYIA